MTKNVSSRRPSALCGLVFGILFSLTTHARTIFPSNSNELIFVQIPSLNSPQQIIQQPVINPNQIYENDFSKVNHLWPSSINYVMKTNSVEVELLSNMQIAYQYNYSFSFDLQARNGQGRAISIPDGWYQLKIAVIKRSGDGLRGRQIKNPYERYVTSTSMFQQVTNGSFGRDISLVFPDVRETALLHHLFIELIPLKEECEHAGEKVNCINLDRKGDPDASRSILEPHPAFKTYLLEMPFTPFNPRDASGRRDLNDLKNEDYAFLGGSLAKFIARAQLYRQRGSLQGRNNPTPAEHATKHGLKLMNTSDEAFKSASKELDELLDYRGNGVARQRNLPRSLLITICKQLAPKFPDLNKQPNPQFVRAVSLCLSNPEEYFQLNRVIHIGRPITGKVEKIAADTLNYTLMANVMSSRSHSEDTFESIGLKIPVISKFLDQIGISLTHTRSVGNSRSRAESGIASLSTTLDFNYAIFNVPSTGAQKCLEVRTLPASAFFTEKTDTSGGLYICGEKETQINNNPVLFAHVFQRCKSTTMTDCNSMVQKLNLSLRGDSEVTGFFYAIRKGVRPDHDNHVQPFGDMDKAEQYFANIPTTGDMQIVNPIPIRDNTAPSFMRQIIPLAYEEKID